MSNYGAPIHIHTGTTCGDSQLVAGHYYASPADPWDTRTLVTDGAGTTTGTIAGVRSGICAASSVGHAIVVHDRSNRIACGVCVPTCTATMAPYPGYASSVNLAGTVKATATGMDHFSGTIDYFGLPADRRRAIGPRRNPHPYQDYLRRCQSCFRPLCCNRFRSMEHDNILG